MFQVQATFFVNETAVQKNPHFEIIDPRIISFITLTVYVFLSSLLWNLRAPKGLIYSYNWKMVYSAILQREGGRFNVQIKYPRPATLSVVAGGITRRFLFQSTNFFSEREEEKRETLFSTLFFNCDWSTKLKYKKNFPIWY